MSREELADLLADVRALLEDARARGAWSEPLQSTTAPQPQPRSTPAKPAAPPKQPPRVGSRWGAVVERARSAPEPQERGAAGLESIRAELGECTRCALHKGRHNIVFGGGHPQADLAIVGEGPGRQEDLQGAPFVGPAGEMLDKMLVHVLGLGREQVHILNVVKCRPPRNRDPLPDEIATCRPFLERQLEAISPRVILVLGRVALGALLGVDGIKRHRGRWMDYRGTPALPTFHPAYLLRQPQDKRLVFEDLKALKARYDELGGMRD